MRSKVEKRIAAHHHDQIQSAFRNAVPTEDIAYFTFDAIAIHRPWHVALGRNDTQPGFFQLIAYKEKLEILVCDTF